jgi:hypothetical protein
MHSFRINVLIQMQIEVHYEYNQLFLDTILLMHLYKQGLNYTELEIKT